MHDLSADGEIHRHKSMLIYRLVSQFKHMQAPSGAFFLY